MDFQAEQLPFDMSSSFTAMKTYDALDLSRRRDSVETRKTPSPHTSSFGENSTPMHDSPSTTSSMPINHSRTGTPIHYDTSPLTSQFSLSPPDYNISHSYRPKRKTPSPNGMIYKHLRQSCATSTPYLLHTKELHQSIAQYTPTSKSVESLETSSLNTNMNFYPMVVGRNGKLSRPFKAYPKDPLSLTASFSVAESLDSESAEKYSTFRNHILQQIHEANGRRPTVSNKKMRRSKTVDCKNESSMEDFPNDSVNNNNKCAFIKGERRKRNIANAKKFRDDRRIKQDEIAIRTAFLERENMELKIQLAQVLKLIAMFSSNSSS